MKLKLLCATLSIALALSLTACNTPQSQPAPSPTPPAEQTPEVSQTEDPEANVESHYPIEIVTYNYEGEEVITVYEKAPERVLAVYQGSIETMIALGLEERVIASYGLDNEVKEEWKDGLSKMNYSETSFAPDLETVVTMQPDLILSWGSLFGERTLGDVPYWHERGTNTYINTNTRRGGARLLEHEYTDILNIGKIFDVEDRAEAIVNTMKADVELARAAVANESEVPTVAVIRISESSIRNYGMELGGDIVKSLGLNVMTSVENTLGKEDLILADPDIIFIEYMPRPDRGGDELRVAALALVLDDPSLASLSAVNNNRVYAIMLGDIYAPAVRTGDGIRTIAEGVFPSIFD